MTTSLEGNSDASGAGSAPRPRGATRAQAGLAGIAVLTLACIGVFGAARAVVTLGGPADLGPVEIETLVRRATPNDALACSPGLCAAAIDLALPVYAETPDRLIARLDGVVLADRRNLRRVDDGTRLLYRRYVARTPVLRFPDTIDAEAFPALGGAGLALYGRSMFGSADIGVNRARLAAWAYRLGARPETRPTP